MQKMINIWMSLCVASGVLGVGTNEANSAIVLDPLKWQLEDAGIPHSDPFNVWMYRNFYAPDATPFALFFYTSAAPVFFSSGISFVLPGAVPIPNTVYFTQSGVISSGVMNGLVSMTFYASSTEGLQCAYPSWTPITTSPVTLKSELLNGESWIACTNFGSNPISMVITSIVIEQNSYGLKVTMPDAKLEETGPPVVFTAEPSLYGEDGCKIVPNAVIKSIGIQCLDQSTPMPYMSASGCSYRIEAAPGSNDGGHSESHTGSRPLGKFSPTQPDAGFLPIAQAGSTVSMEMPDVSGEIDLTIRGTGPQGETLDPVVVTVRVKTPGFSPISVAGLGFSVKSHPLGINGLPETKMRLEQLVANFRRHAEEFDIPLDRVPELRSEAGSLPWGGIFDIDRDWFHPHCGHRDGRTLDLSMSVLKKGLYTVKLKDALANAVYDSNFEFYEPESPADPDINHWHIYWAP